mmetsp:Transcript_5037/g.5828  ORF Transcript_5037/g.5828 Transcript_5037/m.5828 type:complete len:199 (+) Transcript_5037:219-815(+)
MEKVQKLALILTCFLCTMTFNVQAYEGLRVRTLLDDGTVEHSFNMNGLQITSCDTDVEYSNPNPILEFNCEGETFSFKLNNSAPNTEIASQFKQNLSDWTCSGLGDCPTRGPNELSFYVMFTLEFLVEGTAYTIENFRLGGGPGIDEPKDQMYWVASTACNTSNDAFQCDLVSAEGLALQISKTDSSDAMVADTVRTR